MGQTFSVYGQLNPRDASVGTFLGISKYDVIILITTLHSKIHPADWWKALDEWPFWNQLTVHGRALRSCGVLLSVWVHVQLS